MAKIENIKPGDELYSVEGRERNVYTVTVLTVDYENKTFCGYRNENVKIPQKWNESQIKKLQYKEPK